MKILEKILVLFVFVSLFLKLNIMHGGGLLLLISFSLLSLLYFPFGVFLFKRRTLQTNLPTALVLTTGLGLSMICIGALFKMLQWPVPNLNLILGLSILLISASIALLKFIDKEDEQFTSFFTRIIIAFFAGTVFLIIPYTAIEKIRFRNHPKYLEAYDAFINNPNDSILKRNVRLEYDRAIYSSDRFIELHPVE